MIDPPQVSWKTAKQLNMNIRLEDGSRLLLLRGGPGVRPPPAVRGGPPGAVVLHAELPSHTQVSQVRDVKSRAAQAVLTLSLFDTRYMVDSLI